MCNDLVYEYDETVDRLDEELINGEIVLMAPSPTTSHIFISENILTYLRNKLKGKKCLAMGDGHKVYLTEKDRFIPDAMIVCDKSIIKEDGIHGVPDLVVEILSRSTAKRDKDYKKRVYEKCGVKEYWIVDGKAKQVEVYHLTNNVFKLSNVYEYITPDTDLVEGEEPYIKEIIRVSVCDNVWIPLWNVFENTF